MMSNDKCVNVSASLPAHVPQILINKEHLRGHNFDIELLGDCDMVVGELSRRLGAGWEATAREGAMVQVERGDLPTPPPSPPPSPSPPPTPGLAENSGAEVRADGKTEEAKGGTDLKDPADGKQGWGDKSVGSKPVNDNISNSSGKDDKKETIGASPASHNESAEKSDTPSDATNEISKDNLAKNTDNSNMAADSSLIKLKDKSEVSSENAMEAEASGSGEGSEVKVSDGSSKVSEGSSKVCDGSSKVSDGVRLEEADPKQGTSGEERINRPRVHTCNIASLISGIVEILLYIE